MAGWGKLMGEKIWEEGAREVIERSWERVLDSGEICSKYTDSTSTRGLLREQKLSGRRLRKERGSWRGELELREWDRDSWGATGGVDATGISRKLLEVEQGSRVYRMSEEGLT